MKCSKNKLLYSSSQKTTTERVNLAKKDTNKVKIPTGSKEQKQRQKRKRTNKIKINKDTEVFKIFVQNILDYLEHQKYADLVLKLQIVQSKTDKNKIIQSMKEFNQSTIKDDILTTDCECALSKSSQNKNFLNSADSKNQQQNFLSNFFSSEEIITNQDRIINNGKYAINYEDTPQVNVSNESQVIQLQNQIQNQDMILLNDKIQVNFHQKQKKFLSLSQFKASKKLKTKKQSKPLLPCKTSQTSKYKQKNLQKSFNEFYN